MDDGGGAEAAGFAQPTVAAREATEAWPGLGIHLQDKRKMQVPQPFLSSLFLRNFWLLPGVLET
jgi:hypothetical protein